MKAGNLAEVAAGPSFESEQAESECVWEECFSLYQTPNSAEIECLAEFTGSLEEDVADWCKSLLFDVSEWYGGSFRHRQVFEKQVSMRPLFVQKAKVTRRADRKQ